MYWNCLVSVLTGEQHFCKCVELDVQSWLWTARSQNQIFEMSQWKDSDQMKTCRNPRPGHLSLLDGHVKRKLWREKLPRGQQQAKNNWRTGAQSLRSVHLGKVLCSEHFRAEGQQEEEDDSQKSSRSSWKHVVHSHDRKCDLWSDETKVERFDLNS